MVIQQPNCSIILNLLRKVVATTSLKNGAKYYFVQLRNRAIVQLKPALKSLLK